MSQAPSMPLWTDAYLADTRHLSTEEHGAYLLLLMAIWRNNGQPLLDDPGRLARIVGVTQRRWETRIRPALLSLFIDEDGASTPESEGLWRQKRLEKEWAFVAKRAAISRENGARGGQRKALKNNNTENPAVSSQVTQEPSTHTQTQDSESFPSVRTQNPPSSPQGDERDLLGEEKAKKPPPHPLPEHWQPTDALLAWAAEKAPHVRIGAETQAFKAYWRARAHGSEGRKSDWGKTWRTWMTREETTAVRKLADKAEHGAKPKREYYAPPLERGTVLKPGDKPKVR